MNPFPPRPVDLCSRCGSTQTAPNSCPCGQAEEYRALLGGAPTRSRTGLMLGIGVGFTLLGGCMGALSPHSSSIMLSDLDGAVRAVVGAAIGFALGMALALAVYVGSKPPR